MTHWLQTLRRAALSGTTASTLSLAALTVCGVRDCRSAFAPVNAVSHWIWARRALRQADGSLRYTLPGYAIHHAASVFWALFYEEGVAWLRPVRVAQHVGAGAAVAAIACFVDLRMTPERLTPGFERRLSNRSLAWVYLAFGAGLALPAVLKATRR
ncbi:hypothetical protein [Aromatoleum sp.]|uniref:hypothetical protein n=1 Tax=Aromatoleum sp. TaxID=2307007 RepID=UPI002FC6B710